MMYPASPIEKKTLYARQYDVFVWLLHLQVEYSPVADAVCHVAHSDCQYTRPRVHRNAQQVGRCRRIP
jgi:hypothetical protein